MKQRTILAATLAALLVVPFGCDDAPPEQAGWQTASPADPQTPPPAPPPAAAPEAGEAQARLPQLALSDSDFVESDKNRDPFRSFLGEFKPAERRLTKMQRKVILPRFGLDELALIAVVSGNAVRPRAMFRDPTGLGVTVKRGDFISKSGSKVKRILRDKVVVEIEEQVETRDQASRKSTYTDRIIELHPKEREVTLPSEFDAETATPVEAPAQGAPASAEQQ